MSIKQQIKDQLSSVLKDLGIEGVEPGVEYPGERSHGDYSSNVAMVAFAKKQKATSDKQQEISVKGAEIENPRDLAEEIEKKLGIRNKELGLFEKVEVAGPGFLNFTIANDILLDSLNKFDSGKKALAGKKIMVEFTDPNPFKEFHIGHLYSNIIGESISRLLESQGAEVWRVNYQGDVGMHVAKALFGLFQKLKTENLELKKIDELSLDEKVKILGKAYAYGARAYEDDEKARREINEINKKVYDKDPEVMEIYEKGRKWSLEYFEEIYKRLGTEFKQYYFESEVGLYGSKYVKDNLGKVFTESKGAIVFEGEKYGLHTRVFINSQGLPTYEAKELGLAPTKYKDFKYDTSIIVTGNEIVEYFKVLLKALSLINPDLADKTKHLPHGMVRLPGGKMSSRAGINRELTGMFFISDAKHEIGTKKMNLKPEEINSDSKWSIAEEVGMGAVKYAFLKSNIGSDIVFNLEESISFEGNSGPYIQYAYVRTQSVLERGKREGESVKTEEKNFTLNASPLTLEKEERELLLLLSRFEEVVAEAAERYAPNVVATYLFELAQSFNLFYQKMPILKAEGDVKDLRLFLTEKTGKVLKKGLYLLGIKAPERM